MAIDSERLRADEHPMSTATGDLGLDLDLPAIELWTAWVAALMRQAADKAQDPSDRWVLDGAASDAAALRQLVDSASGGWLDESQVTTLSAIYELWAANHDRHELLAARVDPEGHRVWADRSAAARPARRKQRVAHRPSPRYIGDPDAQIVGSGAAMADSSSSA